MTGHEGAYVAALEADYVENATALRGLWRGMPWLTFTTNDDDRAAAQAQLDRLREKHAKADETPAPKRARS